MNYKISIALSICLLFLVFARAESSETTATFRISCRVPIIVESTEEGELLEIEEETGLTGEDVELINKGDPYVFFDDKLCLQKVIYPYLFHVKDRSKIMINWEHREMRWIKPVDIDNLATMPRLKETLARVLTW